MYDEYGDGIDLIDYEIVEQECNEHAQMAWSATKDRDLVVGVHPNGKYDYELWIDGGKFGNKTTYYMNFEELREAIKEKYPDADWEDVGW